MKNRRKNQSTRHEKLMIMSAGAQVNLWWSFEEFSRVSNIKK